MRNHFNKGTGLEKSVPISNLFRCHPEVIGKAWEVLVCTCGPIITHTCELITHLHIPRSQLLSILINYTNGCQCMHIS